MWTDQLNPREIAIERARLIQIRPGVSRYSKETSRATGETCRTSIGIEGHAIKLIPQSQIHIQVRTKFEIVLKKEAEFALAPSSLFGYAGLERRMSSSGSIEGLNHRLYRAA